MSLQPTTLGGTHVQLEPYREDHIPDLWAVGNHEALWRYMPFRVSTEEELGRLVRRMMDMASAGSGLGFVQRAISTGEIVGGTSYLGYAPNDRRVEVGATWVTPAWQRSAINTEAKLLLLTHAFEPLDCVRVEFKTDALNVQSQRALERIGAVREGTLRAHMIMPDGRLRDSVYFSILQTEWPSVKAHLTSKLHAAG